MTPERLAEFFTRHPVLVLAFVFILGALVWTFVQGRAGGARRVGPADATRLINHEDALVVDVRSEAEFNQGHILNAVNVPQKYAQERAEKLDKHRERPVILACRAGQDAPRVGAMLVKRGFEKVYCLSGGVQAWEGAHLPLTKK